MKAQDISIPSMPNDKVWECEIPDPQPWPAEGDRPAMTMYRFRLIVDDLPARIQDTVGDTFRLDSADSNDPAVLAAKAAALGFLRGIEADTANSPG